jgi:DNA replicative helicase MCM subunit Mcm2 (Cdc46/Mcm family)
MTAETKTTVYLSELKSVEFECKVCHARVIVPISEDAFVPGGCPSPTCKNQHWYTINSGEHRELKGIIDSIRRYQSSQNYSMRFEVESLKTNAER